MKFIADLHVHSKYSRATAKNLDLENLYIGALLKGITLVATGDFTHPAWFAEINEKLVPAEPGLFRLKPGIEEKCSKQVPQSCCNEVRFILESEISNIYKKNGKTRKNHNLVYMPDLETAARFNAKLDSIGNIKSDGRPILGLDAKNLLEIMLECSDRSFLIPAHIWTPWFSLFGSKSGFDSIEECFEDLSPEIFAVETGLSSDAPMNHRISELDSRTLISNSDAHSAFFMGRNANIFNTDLSFSAVKSALKNKDPEKFLGTLDLYPEEGKYHMDGHRKCEICLQPSQTISNNYLCPACEKPVTLGVMHRVEVLADRNEGYRPDNALPYQYIIPLPEILSEICGVGPRTKTVQTRYDAALESLGPELEILVNTPVEKIKQTNIFLLDKAIDRMRQKQIHVTPGYDGVFGRIKVFTEDELDKFHNQKSLFKKSPGAKKKKGQARKKKRETIIKKRPKAAEKTKSYEINHTKEPENKPDNIAGIEPVFNILSHLNEEQRQAVEHKSGPLLIIAGPGSGKTRTLTHRIAYLIKDRNIAPENVLALTFTNKAAKEMQERVKILLSQAQTGSKLPIVSTFHSLCFQILKEQGGQSHSIIDEDERKTLIREAVNQVENKQGQVQLRPNNISDMISTAKQQMLTPFDNLEPISGKEYAKILSSVWQVYHDLLTQECAFDFDDLIFNIVRLLESDEKIRQVYTRRFKHVLVDEYQDINQGQYRIIRALVPKGSDICVIGDPDQSIYGFRGSDVKYFRQFSKDYPKTMIISLTRNYRSIETILTASQQVIEKNSITLSVARVWSGIKGVKQIDIIETSTEKAEAVAIGKNIENIIGGIGFHSIDFGKISDEPGIKTDFSFSDFAVLYRSNSQAAIIAEILEKAGIPCQISKKADIYGQKGIRELISFLKITHDRGLFSDLRKILESHGKGIGKKARAILKNWFYFSGFTLHEALEDIQQFPIPEMTKAMHKKMIAFIKRILTLKKEINGKTVEAKINHILKKTKLDKTINEKNRAKEALASIIETASGSGKDIKHFFDILTLQADPDAHDRNAEKVSLMTIHASKGLEFPIVFLSGCENGFLPYKQFINSPVDMEEERRLLYVGMTRAKERLFLTHANKRTIYGKIVGRTISPFVKDIKQELLNIEKIKAKKKKKDEQVQLNLF